MTVAEGNNSYKDAGVTSLSFVGTWAAGTAYFTDGAAVKRITGVGASTVTVAAGTNVTGSNPLVSASEGKVVALTSGTNGAFNVSTDGGATFVQTNLIQAPFVINKITFADPNNIFIIADGNSLYKTTDAGVSWQRILFAVTGTYTNIAPRLR